MNTNEKINAVSDLITKVVRENGGKFGKDNFKILEDGTVVQEWFIHSHIAPILLAHAMDLASDKND